MSCAVCASFALFCLGFAESAAAGVLDTLPAKQIWVSTTGSDSNDGSSAKPLKKIQTAVSRAKPGTTIMVKRGAYKENIKFPSTGGTVDKPIVLYSADGPQAAKIVAASSTTSTIKALGTDNIAIRNFRIEGGLNGIQFSQSGTDFTNLVRNVLIRGNVIVGAKEDGVKISQADNVRVLDNRISGAGQEGIDFVNVWYSEIKRNEVFSIKGPAGIFAKGGSRNITIASNYVHDVVNDGITMGGWTSPGVARPGSTTYELRYSHALDNKITNVGKRPLNFLGAWDSTAKGNYLKDNPAYYTVVGVGTGNPNVSKIVYSQNLTITGNTFTRSTKLIAYEAGCKTNVVFSGNYTSGSWSKPVGPASSSS